MSVMTDCLPNLTMLLAQSAALHNHLCPRQVLGVRCGLYAAELLSLDLPQSDKRLFAFVETDGCFADGVSVATGCWFGRRTMRLMDEGKVAVTFVDRHTDQAFRIWPHPQARTYAHSYAPEETKRWHAYLNAYQIMPTDELLCVRPVSLTVSLKALISRPHVRVHCSGCGEEIINEREIMHEEIYLCRSCAGDSYYH